MTEQEEKEFIEDFYKPSTKRDPNAGFIVTGLRGGKTNKDSNPENEKESDSKKDKS